MDAKSLCIRDQWYKRPVATKWLHRSPIRASEGQLAARADRQPADRQSEDGDEENDYFKQLQLDRPSPFEFDMKDFSNLAVGLVSAISTWWTPSSSDQRLFGDGL